MGRVWLARDEMLQRDVAIKEVIPPEWLTAEERDELRLRTLREAQTAAQLSHPHVVQTYDVVHGEERPWIVMEYVPSRSLHQVILEDGPLEPRQVAHIGLCVLAGLAAAHHAGVLHRDVKPHNVLIGQDDRVVLTDFGLATFDSGDGAATRAGLIMGSPQYVSPERARHGTSTVESDLWSLGATLYAAVEGRSPYARSSAMATLTALATKPPDPTRRAGPLRPVLTGLLRRDPRARLSPDEAHTLLLRIVNGESRGRPRLLPRPRRSSDSHGNMPRFGSLVSGQPANHAGTSISVPLSFGPAGFEPILSALAASGAAPSGVVHTAPPGNAPPGTAPPGNSPPGNSPPDPQSPGSAGPPSWPPVAGAPAAAAGPAGAAAAGTDAPSGTAPAAATAGDEASAGREPTTDQLGSESAASPPAGPGPAAPPTARRRRALRWTGAVAAALAVLAAGTAVVLAAPWKGTDTPAAGPTDTPRPAATTPAAVSGAGAGAVAALACATPPALTLHLTPIGPPDTVATNGYQLFDGWSFHQDSAGFGIAVPNGWQYFRSGATACFRDPEGVRILSVDPSRRPSTDPLVGCQREERRLTGNGALPGYRRLRMQEAQQFAKGAQWEYVYDAGAPADSGRTGSTRMRAQTVWFVTSPQHAYAVGWATREFDWQANQNYLSMILGSFAPAGIS